jgi:hypothetical protein
MDVWPGGGTHLRVEDCPAGSFSNPLIRDGAQFAGEHVSFVVRTELPQMPSRQRNQLWRIRNNTALPVGSVLELAPVV